MELEVVIEDPRWTAVDIAALAEKAVASVLHKLSLDQKDCEIVILACDDARIAALNAAFRGKEAPTNVLSWPAQALTPPDLPEKDPDGTMPLGDMALAFETCAREAAEQGKTMTAHVTHLVVHGTLHLLGYDHERDEDAARMEALEVAILCNSGLDDPYS